MTAFEYCALDLLWGQPSFKQIDLLASYYSRKSNAQQGNFILFATSVWEMHPPLEGVKYFVDAMHNKGVRVALILNSWNRYFETFFRSLKCDVLFVDFFLWRMYNQIINKRENTLSPCWSPSATQFLFLTGKPTKPQRIGLLEFFARNNMLEHCTWSLVISRDEMARARSFLRHLSDEQFKLFVEQHTRNPDGHKTLLFPQTSHHMVMPFDIALYANSRVQVVSETEAGHGRPAWITEKIWLSIMNHMPFIVAGDQNTCAKLQNMGFRTFNEYMLISDYDSDPSWLVRQENILKNTKHFLSVKDNDRQIADDIEHNFLQFCKLAEQNKKNVDEYLELNNVVATTDQILPTTDLMSSLKGIKIL